MENPDILSATAGDAGAELPPGNHPLEVAARRGIGPLSPHGRDVWHGQSKPCVTCGQLVPRAATACDYCEQDLSDSMLEKMRAFAGPWFVLEHVRPFPGVSLERVIRQIRRGVITETAIVRGPSTDFQWRYAVETPGLCRYFGRCWKCHERVAPSDSHCSRCLAHLTFEQPRGPGPAPATAGAIPTTPAPVSPFPTPAPAVAALAAAAPIPPVPSGAPVPAAFDAARQGDRPAATTEQSTDLSDSTVIESEELRRLSLAVNQAERAADEDIWDAPPQLLGIRATWIAAALIGVVVLALLIFTRARG